MSKTPNSEIEVKILRTEYREEVQWWNFSHAGTPSWRLYWNPAPGAYLESRGERRDLTPDRVVLIPPNTPFATGMTEKFPHFFVHFSVGAKCAATEQKLHILPAEAVLFGGFDIELCRQSENRLFWAAQAVVHAALALLPQELFSPAALTEEKSVFDRAMYWIERDRDFRLNTRELARKCGSSVNTLGRQFRKVTGLTVKQYLLNRKMTYASQLLADGSRTIKETAERLGFADRYHFSKAFKQYSGSTPGEFRKKTISLP